MITLTLSSIIQHFSFLLLVETITVLIISDDHVTMIHWLVKRKPEKGEE